MLRITNHISIDEREITEDFVRSSGPGGQNVNKLATAVQLRFDVRNSPSLSDDVRARLERIAGPFAIAQSLNCSIPQSCKLPNYPTTQLPNSPVHASNRRLFERSPAEGA